MSQARDFDRLRRQATTTPDDHEPAPGRHTPSSSLDAPSHPIVSGLLQRRARDSNGVADGAAAAVAAASASSGDRLPATLMRTFEASLGADLSSVRIHTGGASAEANHAVGARAYAVGQDIHFGAGQYDPASAAGQHLIAHEVAHTVQQQGSTPSRQNKLAVSTPHDAAEHEADAAADAMIAGRSFSIGAGGGAVARTTVSRDAGFTPGPAPDTSPKQSTPAPEADKQAGREKVLAAQAEAQQAIERVAHWTRDQWSQFIGATVESPAVVWQPTMLRRGAGMAVAAGIGAVAGAASTGAKGLPGIGFLVSKGIDLLGSGLAGMATEKIEGGKTLDAEGASSAGRAAAIAKLREKLNEIDAKSTEAQKGIVPGYVGSLQLLAGRDLEKTDVDAVMAWAQSDIAASRAVAPAGNALYQTMLTSWVSQHAADGNSSKQGVNQTDYKNACKELFGAEGIPQFWAMQVRDDLVEMGLPTAKADAALRTGMPSAQLTGEMSFDTAVDHDRMAKAFTKDQTPAFLHLAQGGGFRIELRYVVAGMARDMYGPGFAYLQAGTYTLVTQGLTGGDKTFVRPSKHTGGTARH